MDALNRLEIDIAARVLSWFDRHGRKHLPWQQDISPYRVWVSEIMLQQTQVQTVIPYYQRFMERLPTVQALAAASEDEVLHLWTGLGYYSRARNLHRTAQLVCERWRGEFPNDVESLSELPGIGRSTAGAIVAIAFQRRAAILDGNVKRVLARFHAVAGYPGEAGVANALWQFAETHTPAQRVADYTQAMMDLGATLCTRSKPVCASCPLTGDCVAYREARVADFPGKKLKKVLPIKTTQMLIINDREGSILLERRPSSGGVWAGLWVFPQIDNGADPVAYCRDGLGLDVELRERWNPFRHTFSHYHFDIEPVRLCVQREPTVVMEADRHLWYDLRKPPAVGLAAPVLKLLANLR